VISGPGNVAVLAVPPANTALHKISEKAISKKVNTTNERVKPSGAISLLTICISETGPMAAYVLDRTDRTKDALNNMASKASLNVGKMMF
jgi:hypothetical protein